MHFARVVAEPRASASGQSLEATADRLHEVLTETLGQQAVHNGVDATVAVTEELQEGQSDAEGNLVEGATTIEDQVDLAGEERKPTDGEERDDNDEHADDAVILFDSSAGVSVADQILYWGVNPQSVGNLPVRNAHDQHRTEVKHDVEEHGIGERHPECREILDADIGHGHIIRIIWMQHQQRFEPLNGQLWGDENKGRGPEGRQHDDGALVGVDVSRL